MCMSCGCMEPTNNHGDARNITQQGLDRAAQAAHIPPAQAAQNSMSCCQQMGAGQGQSAQASASQGASS